MWSHAVVAVIAVVVYISQINLSHFPWWTRAGNGTLLLGTPVLVPYLISARHCWQLYTWQVDGPGRIRVVAFLSVLLTGAVAVNIVLVAAHSEISVKEFLTALVYQTVAYVGIGDLILDVV